MTKFSFYPADRAGLFERVAAEYAFEQAEPTPWTPLRRDLRDCKIALATTAGLRLKTQHEFPADRARGCADWREISIYARPEDFAFDFTTYDPREAERDINVVAPVDRLKELVDRRLVRELNETFFSFFGRCDDLDAFRASAAAVGARMRGVYEVDACFVVPADFACNQTVSVLSRELEKAGVSTVTLVTVREIASQIKVPRPLFVNFPFGRTLGRAHALPIQRSIVADMARVLKTHDRPGRMVDLAYKWEGPVE